MRPRDPRRWRRRRRRALVELHESESSREPDGGFSSWQVAELSVRRKEIEPLWGPEHLERLARTYWVYLNRTSLGLLRVVYGPGTRKIVVLDPRIVLLAFRAPEYELAPTRGTVTWQIDRGLLVAAPGRRRGFLRLTVERPDGVAAAVTGDGTELVRVQVTSEVRSFFPLLAGWGRFTRLGAAVYRATQLRVHELITTGFLRSLARLELAPSAVGALEAPRLSPPVPR